MRQLDQGEWNHRKVLAVVEGGSGAMICTSQELLPARTPTMLDAFIIEKIRKERELRDDPREQLHIDPRRAPPREERTEPEEKPERGIAIIDFNI